MNRGLDQYANWVNGGDLNETVSCTAFARADPYGSTLDIPEPFHLYALALRQRYRPCTINWTFDGGITVTMEASNENILYNTTDDTTTRYGHFAGETIERDLFARVMFFAGLNGIKATIRSELPPRSGIGLSSALTCALLRAALEARNRITNEGIELDPLHIADCAHYIEGSGISITGWQDQLASFGWGATYYEWTHPAFGKHKIEHLLSDEQIEELERRTTLFQSGESHNSVDVNERQLRSFNSGSKREMWYREAAITKEAREAFKTSDYGRLVELLNEVQDMRIALLSKDGYINDFQRSVIAGARDCGAAARVAGAGNGGCIFILTPTPKINEELRSEFEDNILVVGIRKKRDTT